MACMMDGKSGWKFGPSGHCYVGPDARQKAIAQGIASGEISTQKGLAMMAGVQPVGMLSIKIAPERREATAVLAKSFDGTETSLDLDGEAMRSEDVFQLVRSYMVKGALKGHDDEHDTLPHNRQLVEAFFNDDRIASPLFPPDAAVVTLRYPDDEDWELVRTGKRAGFSFDASTWPVIAAVELLVDPENVRAPTAGTG